MAQAQNVADALTGADPELAPELVTIQTTGDRQAGLDDKSRFVKEIELALQEGEIDLAVHSAKDLPAELAPGLAIAAVPKRAPANDVCVGQPASLDELPEGARIGTSSLRRRSQLLSLRPDLDIAELRGNVDTRLGKLAGGGYDAIVLAAAGLERLGRDSEPGFEFDTQSLVPAAGQGALALEVRGDDTAAAAFAAALSDPMASAELSAERAVVTALDASCHTPIGVHARHRGGELVVTAHLGLPDGSEWIRDTIAGDPGSAGELGSTLAARLESVGARDLLRRAEALAT